MLFGLHVFVLGVNWRLACRIRHARRQNGFVVAFWGSFTFPITITDHKVCCSLSTERPLHHSEKILEQVLEWSTLDCPSSAFLVIKKFAGAKRMAGGKGKVCCQ